MAAKVANKGNASSAPEQDFLSTVDLYIDRWMKLPVKYNYQPYQLRYMAKRYNEGSGERRCDMVDVSVFHFSGEVSP